jgi:hypothetical protein
MDGWMEMTFRMQESAGRIYDVNLGVRIGEQTGHCVPLQLSRNFCQEFKSFSCITVKAAIK